MLADRVESDEYGQAHHLSRFSAAPVQAQR
jgi:hypothetical protein